MSPLPPDLRLRLLASVADEPSAPRAAARSRFLRLVVLGAAWTAGSLFVLRAQGGARPASVVALEVGLSALATALCLVAVGARRGMLPFPSSVVAGLAALAGALPFVASATAAHLVPGAPSASALPCGVSEVAVAAAPIALAVYLARGLVLVGARARGAAIFALGGSVASAVLFLHCPCAEVSHLLFGHSLPVAALVGLGALVAPRLLAPIPAGESGGAPSSPSR